MNLIEWLQMSETGRMLVSILIFYLALYQPLAGSFSVNILKIYFKFLVITQCNIGSQG
jgi:hypothetical protein